MTRYRHHNGQRIPFTAEEETQRDADIAQAVIDRQTDADLIAQKVTDKASAVSKLEVLGLSSSEIDALTK